MWTHAGQSRLVFPLAFLTFSGGVKDHRSPSACLSTISSQVATSQTQRPSILTMNFPHVVLALLSTFLLTLLHLPTVNADTMLYHRCNSTGNYTANSTYDLNLQTLLSNLTTGTANSTTNFGFAKSLVGSNPNEIFGLALCRGDVNNSVCYSCLSQAIQDILNLCPYNKESTIYHDFCLLRFSNQNFLSSTDNSRQYFKWNNLNITGSQTLFDSYVTYLMNITADYAAFNSSKKFGTAQLNQSEAFPEIYGLVQCTPDMSDPDCASCLNGLVAEMPKWFSGKEGARILGVRCNIRYEIYSFYSGVSLLSLTAPTKNAPSPAPVIAPTPPVSNPGDQGTERTIHFINKHEYVLVAPYL